MHAGTRIDSYTWRGGREPMLRFGPADGPTVVLALPLFEEANRTRAFGIAILRALVERGIGGLLPELPGQGESEIATEQMRLTDLRAAFAAVPGSHAVALRSGALVVNDRPCWQLAPQTGPELIRELTRIKGAPLTEGVNAIAGNLVAEEMLADLSTCDRRKDGDLDRVVRLVSDANGADTKIDAKPLWRRAEPDTDLLLAQSLATDIAQWVAACAA